MKIKLYIPTCDKYNWLIKPFAYTFNKFQEYDEMPHLEFHVETHPMIGELNDLLVYRLSIC